MTRKVIVTAMALIAAAAGVHAAMSATAIQNELIGFKSSNWPIGVVANCDNGSVPYSYTANGTYIEPISPSLGDLASASVNGTTVNAGDSALSVLGSGDTIAIWTYRWAGQGGRIKIRHGGYH